MSPYGEIPLDERATYWRVIESTVCTGCVDGTEEGECLLTDPEECELRASFPVLVELICDAESATPDTSVVQRAMGHLRATVCDACNDINPTGGCQVHFKKGCVVDRNYSLIAEAVEKIERLAGRQPAEDDLRNMENEL